MAQHEQHQERWTQEAVLGLARAFTESRVLLTGAELDLFTRLAAAPLSAEEVAAQLGADLHALTILLDALTAMELLVKGDGAYRTEPSAARLLVADGPGSILPSVLHSVNLWQRWGQLTTTVAGPQAADSASAAWQRSFVGAMHVIASSLAPRIVALVEPGAARQLLDVGGASGTYTLAFLQASPELRATLFDLAPVVEMARQRISAAGLLDRVTLVAGDFYEDPLPSGHDLAFVSAIIHQNTPEKNVVLYAKVFAALKPGGRVVIRDHVLSPDRTQPKAGALFAVNMLVAGRGGNAYTLDEIRDDLIGVGFTRVRLLHPDARMDGLVEGFKPGSEIRDG